jgi:hypothetical protein
MYIMKTVNDAVTLREIIVLGVVFGLRCYLYKDDTSYSKDENNESTNILTYFFTKEQVNDPLYKEVIIPKLMSGGYYKKYIKYKTKYLQLKNYKIKSIQY